MIDVFALSIKSEWEIISFKMAISPVSAIRAFNGDSSVFDSLRHWR